MRYRYFLIAFILLQAISNLLCYSSIGQYYVGFMFTSAWATITGMIMFFDDGNVLTLKEYIFIIGNAFVCIVNIVNVILIASRKKIIRITLFFTIIVNFIEIVIINFLVFRTIYVLFTETNYSKTSDLITLFGVISKSLLPCLIILFSVILINDMAAKKDKDLKE